jgi:Skp family chaperone for outer membrane proteins
MERPCPASKEAIAVKMRSLIAAFACAILASACLNPGAQAQGAPQGTVMAVIDLEFVLKSCDMLKEMDLRFQEDVNAYQAEMKALEKKLKSLEDDIKGVNRGTQEFKDLEEELYKATNEAQVTSKIRERELAERKAKDLFSIYEQVLDVVGGYCNDQSIDLVMICNGAKADKSQVQSMQRVMSRQILYYSEQIDISQQVIDLLNGEQTRPERPRVGREDTMPTKPRKGKPGIK